MNGKAAGTSSIALIEPMVHEYQARLRAFLFSRVHDRAAADDLAQEVFLVAMQHIGEFDSARPAWPWLLGIARNKMHEHWRETAREMPTDSIESLVAEQEMNEPPDEDPDADRDRLDALRACMGNLAPDARDLLSQTYEKSLDSFALSKRLGRKAGAIRVALHRIRGWLASCIKSRLGVVPA